MNRAGRFCVFLVLAAGSLSAQKPAPSLPPVPQRSVTQPAPLTFTVEVTDKAGHFIPGLKSGDFTLLDDKSPSPVEAFAQHTPGPRTPETAILAIDLVNTGVGAAGDARSQIADFLRKPNGRLLYPMALVLVRDGGVRGLGKTSDDPKVLLEALNAQGGLLRDIPPSAGFWGAAEREQTSVQSLNLLARVMTEMPGRKLLIWVSPGWPIFDNPGVSYGDGQLHRIFAEAVALSRELTQAQATLYDVDPLGGWDAGRYRTFLWEDYTNPLRRWQSARAGDLALQVLASESGGLVLNSSNDVAGEVSTCAQDGSAWYTISFTPRTSEKPNTWHSVQLKVDRPGLIVRTRSGYYAQP
jgi:VWFA-related protein